MTQKQEHLDQFVQWCAAHIRGDEKGEAQIFLDRLFRAFGQPGVKEVGAVFEERVKKEGKGTSFADLVWKPVVLVEMKRRGEDLTRHYRQAFDYWARLVPGRPRWVMLCNFDEFWVYDFETQMDSPVDKVALGELPTRYGPLAFLFPDDEEPVFGNHQETVTREAADKLVELFRALIERKVPRDLAQRFTLQSLMALFAEDIGLLERYFFAHLVDDCHTSAQAFDLIGQLFVEMNTPGITAGGRFKGVPYFNGGLFAHPARIELTADEIELLREAARFDWSKVRPEIFGAIFEHSMGAEERRAHGAHYTSPVDIMKVVGPTIVEPWREQIERTKTLKGLEQLLARIETFRVLDPACGSGNFLYIAYREMKRLEASIYERMGEFKSVDAAQRPFGFVTARNFYGIDINPFAVELAKVTMMLAHKLAIDELHISENALPLDNLDANFHTGDALIAQDNSRTPWPQADAIIGNPPFLGAKLLKPKLGVDYVRRLRKAYPEVPGMADFCVYWFRRAAELLPECTARDPLTGHAGLVGTQNIRNNASRIGGLDAICGTGTVVEAVDNQPWSGEANVHVSIANWMHTQEEALLPALRRLWFKAVATPHNAKSRKRGGGRADKEFELDMREVVHINAALSDGIDVSVAGALSCNTQPQRCFNGQMLGHQGFLLSQQQRDAIVDREPRAAELIHPYLNGVDALTGMTLDRYVLDFEQKDALQAAAYPVAFDWVKREILPDRERKAEEGKSADGKMRPHHRAFLARWWQLSFGRPEMLSVIKPLSRYLCCAYVTKRPIFIFVSSRVRPSNLIQVFGFDDDYSFGLLQSHAHWLWFITKCGKLKSDYRYSAESVFDTFPWPQSPTKAQITTVAEAGRALRAVRATALQTLEGGLRALYRTLDLPGKNPLKDAHAALDTAVLAAYGFSAKKDLLVQLLALNVEITRRLAASQPVCGPGVPATYPAGTALVSADAFGRA
jgi:type I restriction-modification system DNA methylase subunit